MNVKRLYEVKCAPKHTFQDDYPVLNVAISKKEELVQKGMNTVCINIFCLLKANSGTSYHLCDFFLNTRLKKPQSFYLHVTHSHSKILLF